MYFVDVNHLYFHFFMLRFGQMVTICKLKVIFFFFYLLSVFYCLSSSFVTQEGAILILFSGSRLQMLSGFGRLPLSNACSENFNPRAGWSTNANKVIGDPPKRWIPPLKCTPSYLQKTQTGNNTSKLIPLDSEPSLGLPFETQKAALPLLLCAYIKVFSGETG